MDLRPIGIFDSGLGGLTVFKEIVSLMPNENIVYFGDTARIPYGSKSKETVTKFAMQNTRFLLSKNVKIVVVACNTASAYAYETLKKSFDIPIVAVIEPGAKAAVNATKNKRVGVVGTEGTIASGSFEKKILELDSSIKVFSKPCPLFVPLVEEGWTDKEVTYLVAKEYLEEFSEKEIDTLVLGCTHYPFLQDVIKKVLPDVMLINPALETAKQVFEVLKENDMLNNSSEEPTYYFYASDNLKKFESVASIFLNEKIKCEEKIDIEKY
ncbi:glutamate racemase [Caldicellulosiruptor obsidiansis OB47]|uniref:Glutamate racemase n=1 Tax=Caldicellulosiruptor obsidiansis (strain ATCC BAA-2073 / JCM 16842 / OB47) TaxID=608506 RepID=D9TFW4_CALOO|nr:glutamate racemase [Caldicellulosiruptor obsidiansis]ADL43084.1 glutamate racemase [Caldicellulosiruptor obsidiansis OB47]